ncbi:MAG: AAA family ATPase, partial [Myxococcota bacterium]
MLAGPALERPAAWWPAEADAGRCVLTARAAACAEQPTDRTAPTPPLPPCSNIPYSGREDVLAELVESARATARTGRVRLTTIFGAVGRGKTRLLAELRPRLSAAAIEVLHLPAPELGHTGHDAALAGLSRAVLDLPDRPDLDQVRRAAPDCPGLALILGLISDDDSALATLLATPGALRYSVAETLANAMRRRAAVRPLAVLLDDAHRWDPAALDALEIATMNDDGAGLWVCVTAYPQLRELRPMWADRAAAHTERELATLPDPVIRQLGRELMRPAEFVPEAVLDHLCQMAQGVPLFAIELIDALRVGGAIRRHSEGGGHYVAADAILESRSTPIAQRLAESILGQLSPPLAALAQLCAIVGHDLEPEELAGIQELIPAADHAVDPDVGLRRLARAGLLSASPATPGGPVRYQFSHALLGQAVRTAVPVTVAWRIHEAAFHYLRSRSSARPAQRRKLARHAAAAGAHDDAHAL